MTYGIGAFGWPGDLVGQTDSKTTQSGLLSLSQLSSPSEGGRGLLPLPWEKTLFPLSFSQS